MLVNKSKLSILLFLLIGVCFVSCALFYPRPPKGAPSHEDVGAKAQTIIRDVPYVEGQEDNPQLWLDIYSNSAEGKAPVVVLVHGGAWIMGDKTMDNKVFLSKMLASHGFVVFNVNYRLAPKVKIAQQVEDVMAAVIWVKKHASEYGGDAHRIALVGASAGGLLSAIVGWGYDDPFFKPTGYPNSDVDTSVRVIALYYPVFDLDKTLNEKMKLVPFEKRYLTGAGGKKYKELLTHISPVNHIKSGLPPTIILCGDKDNFNLYPQAVEYTNKLRELGVTVELFVAKGKKHGFTWQYWEEESIASVKAVVAFFNKHLP